MLNSGTHRQNAPMTVIVTSPCLLQLQCIHRSTLPITDISHCNLGLRSGFDPPDLDRPSRLPHQQGLCEALDLRRGYEAPFPPKQVNDSNKGSNGPAG